MPTNAIIPMLLGDTMEIEMKYSVSDKETADAIWEDAELLELSDMTTAESVVMKAIYFDTADGDLRSNNVAVRVRSEGDINFATLKWGGKKSEGGLHQREEINIPVSSEMSFINLDPSIFAESPDGAMLLDLIKGKPLENLLEMRFLRRRKRLTYESSVMELALDSGSIITDKGDVPIMEMEIELFAGSENAIKKLGDKLAEKYKLAPKDSSKFKDGMRKLQG